MPRVKGPDDLPRGERSRNQDEVNPIVEANPGVHFFVLGESEFHRGDLGGAIEYFSIALTMLEHSSTSPSHARLRVKALLRRAQCFFFVCHFDKSIQDCTKALNISKAIHFQEGIFDAIMLKIFPLEVTGDILGAFQLAVFLKTLDFKKAISHVRRLRQNLEIFFREDPTPAAELGENLMRTGADFFKNNCFKEAAEYFTEVIRLVCEFKFVREAYIYQAKCYVNLGEYDIARSLCATVLERFPEDEDGKSLLESILERKKGAKDAKKKNSKKQSRIPEKLVVPQKKPVLNKKQRQHEEYRRMKETEEIGKGIRDKINKDREKQEQNREKEKKELDGAKSPPTPSFNVKAAMDASKRETTDKQIKFQGAAGPGARPKQRNLNEASGKTQKSKSGKKTHKDIDRKKDGKATTRGSASLAVADEGRLSLPVKSADTERGVSYTKQTAHKSSKSELGWTVVTSKSHRRKSVAESTSTPDWPSLPGPSFVEDNRTLPGSNATATKPFAAYRVERKELKSGQRSREHLRRGSAFASSGFADNTDCVPQQSPNSSRQSAGQDSFHMLSHAGSPRWDLFSNSSTESKTVDFGKERESLEKISPLQIHHNLKLAKEKGVLNTKAESAPSLNTGASPQTGLNFSWAPPPGVYTLCAHFLQDNRKGQPFRHPKPCSDCTKRSKIEYGIWRSDAKEWQVMRPYPKHVSHNVPFQLCKHFSNGVKCQNNPCTFAHGNEELMFWTSVRQSGRAPFGRNPDSLQENDFQDNSKPQERVRGSLIFHDIRSNEPRPPPTGVNNGEFQLCKWWKSRRVCRYGTHCTSAHGENELKSWMGFKSREIQEPKTEVLACQKPETSADMSRSEIQMVYSLPGVEVSSNKPTTVKISHHGEERPHMFHWEFTVKFEIREVGKLCEIDLLHRYHDCYRLTKIMGFFNNIEIFSEVPEEQWLYKLPSSSWIDTKGGQMEVVVSVSFETIACNRTFTQCLRFDFGRKPYLLQGLNVDISSEEALDTLSATRQELKLHSSVWTEGSVKIIPSPETTGLSSQDMLLLKKYKLPERIENVISAQIIDGKVEVKVEDYKRVMHQLLFTEELFMKKAISSFVLKNVQLDCQQSISNDWSGVVYAGSGELFGIFKFQDKESLQPDDAAGRLLVRNVNCAWIKMAGSTSQKVYEVPVQKVENECVILKLSSQMCLDLNVSAGGPICVDVQFQLNRKPLCDWHAAIDRLGPIQLRLLFPTPRAPQIELEEKRAWNWLALDPKLNTKQREVIKRILAPGDTSSPLVVFGPFGTGKTFTLNQAIRHLVTMKNNRILLCTHTNSAADIHVRLLHDYLTKENGLRATRPLRIYQTNRRLNADSEVARMYGLTENNAYVLPTRDDVIRHRVVITTLAMSQHLLELQLNHGFFTHILVDEAAQALEPEALIPLALAGPNTKVVFTGDHMQMSPEVYSRYAQDWGLQSSLPERLFDHYYTNKQLDNNVMFLTENYRSHPDILQFPSDNFYGKALIARGEQALHPRFEALLFFSVHGVEEARENSYINTAEVDEIVKRVKLLADDWPVEWKKKDLSKIGVISAYMTQVRAIRTQLRSKGLGNVTVESIYNVQGKEFRALFITTVRTSLTCHSFDRNQDKSRTLYWEFLSDPKLLNTAITRAMSVVAVVGDPVSLCTAGDCRGNWRDYIRRCHESGTLHGASYEEIKNNIDAPLANVPLNPQAIEFVPHLREKSHWEVDKISESSSSFIEDRRTIPTEKHGSGIDRDAAKEEVTQGEPTADKEKEEQEEEQEEQEEEEEEQQKASQFSTDSLKNNFNSVRRSEDQQEFDFWEEPESRIQSQKEDFGQSVSGGFDEFLRETFEDETVFPSYLDQIIKALVEKCKATKEEEARLQGLSENSAFPSLHAATRGSYKQKSKTGKLSGKQTCQSTSSSFDDSSGDYEICVVNGRHEVRIVNLGFHHKPSDRHQRLTTVSRQNDFLEPQLLQQLLDTKPDKYLSCTLRLNSEIIHTAYAEISDTKTPDIKIRGRVRGAFDMDHVVVEKTVSSDGFSPCQGKVAGVLNHVITPHERQYVCKVDYENPELMIPINKSMSKIVNLSGKDLNGLPVYKEIHDGSERPIKVDVMDFTEALSGKYLFLVQYLQWRSDCHNPLGIVIKKLTQGNTLSASMKILFAAHGVRDRFSKECVSEVQAKFPPGWSIPDEQDGRQKIYGAFTIDPDNSKDLDDALTLEQLSDSMSRVGVHIADVSYFVEPGTHLDKEAMFRSTSYYPGHDYSSVPMLPRELSENHCSLLPGKDRLCVSVFFDVSEEGHLVGQPEIRRTIVRSSCQLTYPEAQKVIDGQDTSLLQIPQDVKGNIRSLSTLAQKRRKFRLREASLDHWSNSDDVEDFEAHELVEEMMLLANEEIAKSLSRCEQISERAPLRTQLPPKDHKLDDWVKQYGQFIKYSLFLRGFYSEEILQKMTDEASNGQNSEASQFKMKESVWSEICNAVEAGDQAKLHKLICNESNHPQLAVANSQFRRIQPKAKYVCKGDQPEENVLHFSLGMGCYTQFTSPIRRYIDIQVHRLLLDLIADSPNAKTSSKDQVAKVCRRSTFAQDNSRKFDKASSKAHLAAKLKEKSHETTAVVALIDTDKEISLEILNHEYNHLSTRQRKVKLSSLNPFDVIKPAPNGLEVTWRLRLYIAPEGDSIEEPEEEKEKIALLLSEGMARNRKVVNLPTENWLEILKAIQEGDYGKLNMMIRKTESQLASLVPESNPPGKSHKTSKDEKADKNLEHFYEKKLFLRKFDIVNIQLTAHMTHGVFHPEIQLFKINPTVNVCIEHRKYPRDCFATTARYQASRKTYASMDKYIEAWKPVLAMEAATRTVDESDEFTMHQLKIEWREGISGNLEGSFSLQNEYCSSRQIEFHAGDFVCVRVREDSYMKKTGSEINFASPKRTETEVDTNILNEDKFGVMKSAASLSVKGKLHHESVCASESFWVGHCIINSAKESPDKVTLKVTMNLHQSASDFPVELLSGVDHLSTLTVIHRLIPHRRMFAALCSLPSASRLAHSICMGHEPSQENFGPPPSSHLSIVREHPNCGFKPLNEYQEEAVKEALGNPFTLIQGPPGTGKTVTGVHVAYWFVKRNMQQRQDDFDFVQPDSDDQPEAPPQVIYCGPSNKSVDVVAKYMLKIPDLKIIRVYGDRREQTEFPIPNKRQPLKNPTDDETQILNEDNELKAVSLHHVIRRSPCPFAAELREYEGKFDADRKNNIRTSNEEVKEYRELIGQAESWALQKSGVQIILCTCTASGKPRLTVSCDNIQQCIVDECGMCMELESLVPITCSGARQVVLIGDHKQLQPVIQDNLAITLGLSVSMFERLSERAKMLELQYRMQEEICRFPSDYFYEKKLKTDPSVSIATFDPRLKSFWPAPAIPGKNFPMAFCHVEGEEESSSIKTAHSNEQSKANKKEVGKVVYPRNKPTLDVGRTREKLINHSPNVTARDVQAFLVFVQHPKWFSAALHVVTSLVYRYNVDASKVVILSPYREQRSKISESLKKVYRFKNIPVTTIVKSQGSEWDYVILSLVRSLSKDEIDHEPSHSWLREHLGFLTDEHQMNVGLTRARKGLCIIGNKNLLKLHPMWRELLKFYEENSCLVNESDWPETEAESARPPNPWSTQFPQN